MTGQNILDQLRFRANTDSTNVTDAQALQTANIYYRRLVTALMDLNEDFFLATALSNLVANQEAYAFNTSGSDFNKTDVIKIKRVEITYDGTTWYRIEPIDSGKDSDATDSTTINNTFVTSKPYAEVRGYSLYLRPIPTSNVTNGLRIWYVQRQTDIVTTSSPVLPADYHDLIVTGSLIDVWDRFGDRARSAAMEAEYLRGVVRMKEEMTARIAERVMQFTPSSEDYT